MTESGRNRERPEQENKVGDQLLGELSLLSITVCPPGEPTADKTPGLHARWQTCLGIEETWFRGNSRTRSCDTHPRSCDSL
ncbi:hypothetical protein PoB_004680600 [Plakobranchus ocellatus]|uniref:Uncharacterized protein n=1 Tax=Plakobranchus ocellatus TaxID=259542 RepID=A0AAV4BIP3_9GAST|nr:hypothetical protein PoB_004680600 [Plakobranchus ocellatus]